MGCRLSFRLVSIGFVRSRLTNLLTPSETVLVNCLFLLVNC